MEARPPASACTAGAPLLMAKAGGKPAGRGISISPSLHPPLETTNQGGLGPPIGCTPQSCPTGSLPAAKAYFVTPPPLERRRKRTAARRARPVQRNRCQGLQGNPDACHPGRGSACDKTARKTCGNARLVFAGQLQPTAAMSPRIGGPGWAKPPGLSFPPLSFGKKAVPRPGRPALRGAPPA